MNFSGRAQAVYREDAYEEGQSSEMTSRPNDRRLSRNAVLYIFNEVSNLRFQ